MSKYCFSYLCLVSFKQYEITCYCVAFECMFLLSVHNVVFISNHHHIIIPDNRFDNVSFEGLNKNVGIFLFFILFRLSKTYSYFFALRSYRNFCFKAPAHRNMRSSRVWVRKLFSTAAPLKVARLRSPFEFRRSSSESCFSCGIVIYNAEY